MSDWQIAGVAWLALSFILAPMVGRMIHDRSQCPQCIAEDARRRAAHRRWDA